MKKVYISILFICLSSLAFAQNAVLVINSPAGISGNLTFGTSGASTTTPDWGFHIKAKKDSVNADVAIAIDSTLTDSTKRLENCTLGGTAANVKGKYALIRRGTCGFSTKAVNAFKAGAVGIIIYSQETQATQIIGLSLGNLSDTIVNKIPVFLISYTDAQKIVKSINAGVKVNITYKISDYFYYASQLNYATPLKETQTYQFGISTSKIIQSTATDNVPHTLKVKVVEPDGKIVTSAAVSGTVYYSQRASDSLRDFNTNMPLYTPTKLGKYQVSYSNNKTAEVVLDSFVITNYTFAQDKLGVVDAAPGIDTLTFIKGNLIFNVGHFYYNGVSPDKATHGIFAIGNPTKFPKGEIFNFSVYEATAVILSKFDNGTLTYDDLGSVIAGGGSYTMTGKERFADSLLTIEFKKPITLNDTSTYLVMAEYDGSLTGNQSNPPFYSASGLSHGSTYYNTDVVYTLGTNSNVFYAGWQGNTSNIVRLEMAGFKPGTIDTKTLEAWEENQVTVFPNPVTTQLTLNFDLQTLNPTVDYLIINAEGVEIKAGQFKNVQTGTQTINVSNFANGLYFVRLLGSDGWRTKAFVITK